MRLIRFLIIGSIACLFAPEGSAQDYSITESHIQNIDNTNIQSVYLYCYCENGVNRHESEDAQIKLSMIATKDSVGYHGDQKAPKNIPVQLMDFKQTINGSELTLESREYIYIHHGFFVDKLDIFVPKNVKLHVTKISDLELNGRRLD